MNVEANLGHQSRFVEVAQEAAMNKVTDIHNDTMPKHGFVRFGPKDSAGLAIDRLQGILLYGLVAENFAKKKGILFIRNWVDSVNETRISLCNPCVTLEKSFETAIWSVTNHLGFGYPLAIPRENVYVILVANKPKPYAKRTPVEELAKNRIDPQLFKGIVVLDRILSSPYSECVDFTSTTAQETADFVVSKMKSINKDRADFCIPVYGLSGSLYWPMAANYEEVQNIVFAKERRSNGVQTNHRS